MSTNELEQVVCLAGFGPEYLRAFSDQRDGAGNRVGVDRSANIIFGAVIAELGTFKSERGRFDDDSLAKIVSLMNAPMHQPRGVGCRFAHPNVATQEDSLGKFLGRWKNPRVDGSKVRADLLIDRTALKPPPFGGTPLAEYIMDLVESDPLAVGVSLVLRSMKRQSDRDGFGSPRPPVWTPTAIMYADIVAEGDSVSSFLGLPESEYQRLVAHARWRHLKRRMAGI